MRKIFFIVSLAALLLLPNAYAHGFGSKIDLPLPTYLYWIGGGAAVIASFAIISIFVNRKTDNDSYWKYNLRNIKSWIRSTNSKPVLQFGKTGDNEFTISGIPPKASHKQEGLVVKNSDNYSLIVWNDRP